MKRRNVSLLLLLIIAVCLAGVSGSIILYFVLSAADKNNTVQRVTLSCISVSKVIFNKFQTSNTLLLAVIDRIANYGWFAQSEFTQMIDYVGIPLAWPDMKVRQLQLVSISDFNEWQSVNYDITYFDTFTKQITPEDPVREWFLPVLTTYPCCQPLGYDWLSESTRVSIVAKGLQQNATSMALLPNLPKNQDVAMFAPVFSRATHDWIGGVVNLYNSETIFVGTSDDNIPLLSLALYLNNELIYKQADQSFDIEVNETFAVFDGMFILTCGNDFSASVAPLIMMILGICLSLLIPVIAFVSWLSLRSLRAKDRQILSTQNDLREARLRERELRLLYENERTLSEAKSQFMANISHEIRTPLNAIQGMLDFLLESDLQSAQRNYAKSIKASLVSLLAIISDVFDYILSETSDFTINKLNYDFYDFINTVDRTSSKAANEQGNTFILDCPLEEPTYVSGDSHRLRQILRALISNANKFTDKGTITLTVRPNFEEHTLVFSITDTGIGMTDEQQAEIFKPYRQSEQSHSRRYSGIGLGLAFCQRLVEKLGGHIAVWSEVNKGSRFTVTIPLERGIQPEEVQRQIYRGTGLVLIADDNALNLKIAEKMVKDLGYTTICATNGQQAIEQYMEHQDIDLILMDGQMPVMDGYEATQELRRRGVTIPIVCITANALPGEKERVRSLGMTDLIPKPIDKWLLSKILHELIHVTT